MVGDEDIVQTGGPGSFHCVGGTAQGIAAFSTVDPVADGANHVEALEQGAYIAGAASIGAQGVDQELSCGGNARPRNDLHLDLFDLVEIENAIVGGQPRRNGKAGEGDPGLYPVARHIVDHSGKGSVPFFGSARTVDEDLGRPVDCIDIACRGDDFIPKADALRL